MNVASAKLVLQRLANDWKESLISGDTARLQLHSGTFVGWNESAHAAARPLLLHHLFSDLRIHEQILGQYSALAANA